MASTTEGRRQRVGMVLSDRNAKTVIVGVKWSQKHPLYRKNMRRLSKFVAHDENSEAKRGDTVLIEETRPLSAAKRWRLVKVITKGAVAEVSPEEAGAAPEALATASRHDPAEGRQPEPAEGRQTEPAGEPQTEPAGEPQPAPAEEAREPQA